MKVSQRMIATALLGCAALFAGSGVQAEDDLDICRAGYKVLLMTPGECNGYLSELRAAQARADSMAVLDLQEWHTRLLIERAQACPCELEPGVMRTVRAASNSQLLQAYSDKH